eukprot:scaffold18.g1902.t1
MDLWQILRCWLEPLWEPAPGTSAHRDLRCRVHKEFLAESDKPAGQRDEARLQELLLRDLRLHKEFHERAAACCGSYADVYKKMALQSAEELEAAQQGREPRLVALARFELRIPEGQVQHMPPSIDRCAACQALLDEMMGFEVLGVKNSEALEENYRARGLLPAIGTPTASDQQQRHGGEQQSGEQDLRSDGVQQQEQRCSDT